MSAQSACVRVMKNGERKTRERGRGKQKELKRNREGKMKRENMRLGESEIKNEELSDFKRQQNQRKVSLN